MTFVTIVDKKRDLVERLLAAEVSPLKDALAM